MPTRDEPGSVSRDEDPAGKPGSERPESEVHESGSRNSPSDPTGTGPEIAGADETGHRASYLPEGTATDVPAMEGTSVDAPAVQGIYRPEVGAGGEDIDEGDSVLPNRSRLARGPKQPGEPSPKHRPLSPEARAALRRKHS